MSFLERAKHAAGQAASTAAKVSVDVGGKAARAAGDAGGKAAATLRDPATRVRAKTALGKAKRGFTTVLERIDPRILADVVVKATSLQEKANASLKERGSVYRIAEITIGAAIPPSIQFTISRVEGAEASGLADSSTLLAVAAAARAGVDTADGPAAGALSDEAIVSLDGTAVAEGELDELEDDE